MYRQRKNIALAIALLFHICGAVGILATPYKDWFIHNTPLNLLLMSALLVYTQQQRNLYFYLFILIAFAMGMLAEIVGVHTGYLFGNYTYGNVMGYKFNGVPLLIGVQWFVTIYCGGVVMQQLHGRVVAKSAATGTALPSWLQFVSLIIDGALLATTFDYIMEPVAIKLGFWQWTNNQVPFFNYACWFVISAILLIVFRLMPFNKTNPFALHLLIIQLLFFLILRSFL